MTRMPRDQPETLRTSATGNNPLSIIKLAASKVPIVWLALALTAIAAAIGMAKSYLGGISYPGLIVVLAAGILLMLFLFVVSQATRVRARTDPMVTVLMWSICLVVICFMGFTVSAVATGWPDRWALVLRLGSAPEPLEQQENWANDLSGSWKVVAMNGNNRQYVSDFNMAPLGSTHAWGSVLIDRLTAPSGPVDPSSTKVTYDITRIGDGSLKFFEMKDGRETGNEFILRLSDNNCSLKGKWFIDVYSGFMELHKSGYNPACSSFW